MKRVKYIAGVAILLIFVFFLTGVLNKSVEFEQNIIIKRPSKTVYFALINPVRMGEWIQGFEKVEALDGFICGPGSRYLLTFKFGNRKVKVFEEVTVFIWKEELGLKLNFKHITVNTNIRVENSNPGTHLFIKNEIKSTGIFWRSLIPFLKPGIKKHFDQNFINLKEMLEAPR
jgi:hypothetical protein